MAGEQLDLSSESPQPMAERPAGSFVGIHFQCCGVYRRIYPNADRTAYTGHCPRCMRPVRVNIAAGGTSERFFTAD